MGFILQNRGARIHARARRIPTCSRAASARSTPSFPAFMETGDAAHRLRHHGRRQSAPGPRAVRLEHRRLRDEPAGGARSAALHQDATRTGCDVSIEVRVPASHAATALRTRPRDRASAASTRRRWAAARRFCTIRRPGPITRLPIPAPTAPRCRSPFVLNQTPADPPSRAVTPP